MRASTQPITILMADDDPDDCMIIREALKASRVKHKFQSVKDGQELLDYLRRQGDYSEPDSSPCPSLILLDLNMPRKKGLEALMEIKQDLRLRSIPLVVLTTSSAETDIKRAYELGANSFITKTIKFDALVESMKTLTKYWFQMVKLPQICNC
jgi:CheY-like chemotaxis protein